MINRVLLACAFLLATVTVSARQRNNFDDNRQDIGSQSHSGSERRANSGENLGYNRIQPTSPASTGERGDDRVSSSGHIYQSPGVFAGSGNDVRFWFGGHLQADGGVFFGAGKDIPPIGNNAIMRHLRSSMRAEFVRNWGAMFEGEIDDGRFTLRNVLVSYTSGTFRVRSGNFKEDFGMGIVTSATNQWVMEQPMVIQAFAPGYHLGIDVHLQMAGLRMELIF